MSSRHLMRSDVMMNVGEVLIVASISGILGTACQFQ